MTSPVQRRGAFALLIVWFVVAAISTWFHEPWRDEADPWLYARDAPWSTFFSGGRYAGTPTLWFLVQAPFARLGAPYEALGWLHLAIATAAMWLFLSRAPLPWWARVVVAFSFFGAFEYAVVARSYALTLLLLWAACAQWTTKYERPWFFVLVGVLAQTNIPGMILAGALLATALVAPTRLAHRRPWRFFVVAVGFYLLAVLQVWPPADGQKSLTFNDGAMARAISDAVFPWGGVATRNVAAGVLFGVMLLSLRRHRVAAFFYVLVVTGLALLFELVHEGGLRHHAFILVGFVAAAWLASLEATHAAQLERTEGSEATEGSVDDVPAKRPARPVTQLAAVVALVFVPWVVVEQQAFVDERAHRFSNGPAMGKWIAKHKLADAVFVLNSDAVVAAPWLTGTLYYPASKTSKSYLPWNAEQYKYRGMKPLAALKGSASFRQEHPDALLLLKGPIEKPEKDGYKLIHREASHRWNRHGEDLYLYEPVAKKNAKPAAAKPE